MTAPTAFAVDQNSTITPRVGFSVDPSTGAPTMLTVTIGGTQVITPLSGGGGGGGASAFGQLTDAATADIPNVNGPTGVALANRVSVAPAWLAASNTAPGPVLVSGTPLGGLFVGINTVMNTSPGRTQLGTAIDGITSTVYGDIWIFGAGATSTWTCFRAASGVAIPISANLTITTANQDTYNGQILDFQGAYTVTVNHDLVAGFGFAYIPPDTGTGTLASDGTTTFNGSTASIGSTTAKVMGSVVQRASSQAAYKVL